MAGRAAPPDRTGARMLEPPSRRWSPTSGIRRSARPISSSASRTPSTGRARQAMTWPWQARYRSGPTPPAALGPTCGQSTMPPRPGRGPRTRSRSISWQPERRCDLRRQPARGEGRGGALGQAANTTDGQRSGAGQARADAEARADARARAGTGTRAAGQQQAVRDQTASRVANNSSATAIAVVLSTASVFPERTTDAFELAARFGYDGVEVMVTADPVSQEVDVLRRLADYHGIGVK